MSADHRFGCFSQPGSERKDRAIEGSGSSKLWNQNAVRFHRDLRNGSNGGPNSDGISGGDGDDIINGGDGWDDLAGNAGDDVIHGNGGSDDISAGYGDKDEMYGDGGNDFLCATFNQPTCPTSILFSGGNGTDKAWLQEKDGKPLQCFLTPLVSESTLSGTVEFARDDVWDWSDVLDPNIGLPENNTTPYTNCENVIEEFGL